MNKLISILAFTTLGCAASLAQAAPLTPADYVEIEQLYARYNHAIDSGDAEGWAATFTPDGTFNTSTGKDKLVEFVKTWHEKRGGGSRRHWNTNLLINGTPDGATGSVYLMLVDVATRPPAIVATATYSDSLVKTSNGWLFKKRQTKADAAPAAAPAATPTAPTSPAGTKVQ
jgi:hypothetical protein